MEVYIQAESFFHRLAPITKLAWMLAIMYIAVLFLDPIVLLPTLMSVLIVLFFLINAPLKKITQFLRLLISPFIFLWLGFILTQRTGNILFYIDWPWYHWAWITDWGFILGSIVVMRALLLSLVILVFLFTTNQAGMLKASEFFGVSYKFGCMVTIAITFIPTMLGIILSILEAQKARGFRWEKLSIIKKAQNLIKLFLPTMFSAVRYATILPLTMEGRAFGAYKNRTYIDDYTLRTADRAIIIVCVAVLVAITILGYGFRLLMTTL